MMCSVAQYCPSTEDYVDSHTIPQLTVHLMTGKLPDWRDAVSHLLHLPGFTPLWILLWLTRCAACINRCLHSNADICHILCTYIYLCEYSCDDSILMWWKAFLTLSAEIHFSLVCLFTRVLKSKRSHCCEPFVTHCTWITVLTGPHLDDDG